MGALLILLKSQRVCQSLLFLERNPVRIGGSVIQIRVCPQSNNDCREALYQKHPLPILKTEMRMHLQQEARYGTAEDECKRCAEVEKTKDFPPHLSRKPIGQIKNHSREKASFRGSKHQPKQIER